MNLSIVKSARSLAAALGVLSLSACAPTPEAKPGGEWPQFRGPDGRAISEGHRLPTTWSEGSENIRWQTPVPGSGNSSPVVAGGRIFLTSIEDPENPQLTTQLRSRSVLAFDLESGEQLWQTEIFSAEEEQRHRQSSAVAATPVTDGESVWVYFGAHLSRLDLDGKILWTRIIDPTYPKYSRYGVASSPILVGDLIVILQDREYAKTPDIGWVAAFDSASGDEIWRREWSDNCCAYSTPTAWRRDGKDEILLGLSGFVRALDPATGDTVWEHGHQGFQFVSSLVFEDDILCALGGAHANKDNLCLKISQGPDGVEIQELWQRRQRAPETSSPILYQGKIFATTAMGVMSCYIPETGEMLWSKRLGGRIFQASLVAGDGKVYARSGLGQTVVIDALADDLQVLATNDLPGSEGSSTPALAGGCLLLRSNAYLFCIEAESSTADS